MSNLPDGVTQGDIDRAQAEAPAKWIGPGLSIELLRVQLMATYDTEAAYWGAYVAPALRDRAAACAAVCDSDRAYSLWGLLCALAQIRGCTVDEAGRDALSRLVEGWESSA